jgi:hypothetical protein
MIRSGTVERCLACEADAVGDRWWGEAPKRPNDFTGDDLFGESTSRRYTSTLAEPRV